MSGNQDRDLVEEERQAARLNARATDRPRASGMDSGTRKLAIVAGGLGGLLVLMVGGWTLLGHRPAGVPIIAPPPGPVRVKPVDPGGMQLMGAQVAQVNGNTAQSLAPGPEVAAPQALQAEVDAARKVDDPAPAPAPAPVATTAPAVEAPGPATPAPVVTVPAPLAPAAREPATPPASTPPTSTPMEPDAEPASAPAVQDAPAPVPVSTGHHAVQLAALDSDEAAHAEWTRLSHRAPGLFAGHTPQVTPTSHAGKQFFRLRTGGFASTADATAFCARLKAAGLACTLADF